MKEQVKLCIHQLFTGLNEHDGDAIQDICHK